MEGFIVDNGNKNLISTILQKTIFLNNRWDKVPLLRITTEMNT